MRTFAVFVVTGWLALLAGCGGTTGAAPPPSPSPTPTPSASASPTAPVMPDAARENTKAGAVAFVRFYIAAFNHAQATGDVSTLRSLGAKGCVSCNGITSAIASTYAAGGHAEGGDWVITSHDAVKSLHGTWEVDIAGKFKPSVVYASSTTKGKAAHGGPALTNFYVKHSAGGWRVMRWTRVDLG